MLWIVLSYWLAWQPFPSTRAVDYINGSVLADEAASMPITRR